MKKVKITVLRKTLFADLADKYLTEGSAAGPCPVLEEGDVFLYEGNAKMPEGFCPYAWIDFWRSVNSLSAGASFVPLNNHPHRQIFCCTDGVRPVVFAIEATDEDI